MGGPSLILGLRQHFRLSVALDSRRWRAVSFQKALDAPTNACAGRSQRQPSLTLTSARLVLPPFVSFRLN